MSRIGLKPITVPKNVSVIFDKTLIRVKGNKGELTQQLNPLVGFSQENDTITVNRINESKKAKSLHGLYRSLLNNMIIGVSQGYSKVLLINGVGYRAEIKGKTLLLNLGYSNMVEFEIPEGIEIEIEGNTKITVGGINKTLVGKVSAEIRGIRPPEPYKGKGVRYEAETVRRKVGKSGVK